MSEVSLYIKPIGSDLDDDPGIHGRVVEAAEATPGIRVTHDFDDFETSDYRLNAHYAPTMQDIQEVAASLEGLNLPFSKNGTEYAAKPFWPVVAKAIAQRGEGKHFLENAEQVGRFLGFVTGKAQVRRHPSGLTEKDIPLRPGDLVARWKPLAPQERAEALERVAFHNYIKPIHGSQAYTYEEYVPTHNNSSYRVLATATGLVLASSIYYQPDTNKRIVKPGSIADFDPNTDMLDDVLAYSDSLLFLDERDIRSNRSLGGRGIVLDPDQHSIPRNNKDDAVLRAYNIDPRTAALPERVRNYASVIGRTLGPKFGAVLGIDFLQHRDTNDIYFLEANIWPGAGAYADKHGLDPSADDAMVRMYSDTFASLRQ